MYRQLTLYSELQKEFQRQRNLLRQLESLDDHLPRGYLPCKNGYLYRVVREKSQCYQLPISQDVPDRDSLITQLITRQHLKKALPILKSNCLCLKQFLKKFQIYDPNAIRSSLPEHYHTFDFSPISLPGDFDPEAWEREPYEKNTLYPEALKYRSEGGLLTRSKAEADIATILERNHLHFRYEPIITLGKKKAAPDFCVVHPVHRLLIYWEHFGQIDAADYACKTMEKLTDYASHGYYLGINLIMTYETKDQPLHFGHINKCIKQYFQP